MSEQSKDYVMKNKRAALTIVELLVAIAIIAVLAAIAVPNLIGSRIAANEASAASCLKAYAIAQVAFQTAGEGELATNTKTGLKGYCDNFRNLFYGNPKKSPGDNLESISSAFADAFARAPGGSCATTRNVPTVAPGTATPYQGFFFAEPKELLVASGSMVNGFVTKYALLAVPAEARVTGNNAQWIGLDGVVKISAVPSGQPYSTTIDLTSPSTPGYSSTVWKDL